MRRFIGILPLVLFCSPELSFGQSQLTNQLTHQQTQQLSRPRWDVAVSAGVFQSNPGQSDDRYGDDWYFQGRYGVSVGRFWSEHFKTEIELAATGEGTRYTQRYATIPGVPPYYPISVQESFQLNQLSGRAVWQFFENSWVHPYAFGGVSVEGEQRRVWVPEQFYYPTTEPRNPGNRIALSPTGDAGPGTTYRAGAIAGVGAKVYMSPRSYFNTSFVMSQAKPARNVSFIAGFGWDF